MNKPERTDEERKAEFEKEFLENQRLYDERFGLTFTVAFAFSPHPHILKEFAKTAADMAEANLKTEEANIITRFYRSGVVEGLADWLDKEFLRLYKIPVIEKTVQSMRAQMADQLAQALSQITGVQPPKGDFEAVKVSREEIEESKREVQFFSQSVVNTLAVVLGQTLGLTVAILSQRIGDEQELAELALRAMTDRIEEIGTDYIRNIYASPQSLSEMQEEDGPYWNNPDKEPK